MRLLTAADVVTLVRRVGVASWLRRLTDALAADLNRWSELRLSPRHATSVPGGVLELMPCADESWYGFKFVNGHPGNPARGRLSVVALGVLAEVESGYPLLITDMTLLTALRTAATMALGVRCLARPESRRGAMIGAGAQAEFQILALAGELPLEEVALYDPDPAAMAKVGRNLDGEGFRAIPCGSVAGAVAGADVVITATAAPGRQRVLLPGMLEPGMHIHALGGDCPGKTELDPAVLERCKVVVEFLPQSLVEGEVQGRGRESIHAELWEVVSGRRPGREGEGEITLLDSVGIGVEDFTTLRLVHHLAGELGVGREVELLPRLADPKDLYGLLRG